MRLGISFIHILVRFSLHSSLSCVNFGTDFRVVNFGALWVTLPTQFALCVIHLLLRHIKCSPRI